MAAFDLELLLSVVGGLGTGDPDGTFYEKSEDCVGDLPFMRLPAVTTLAKRLQISAIP